MTDTMNPPTDVDDEKRRGAMERMAIEALESGELDDSDVALEDEERISKMMWALAYLKKDLARVEALMDTEYKALARFHAEDLAMLDERRDDLTAGLAKRIAHLSHTIESWHRAVFADAEIRKARKLPISVPFMGGVASSLAGSVQIDYTDESALIEYLENNGLDHMVDVKKSVKKSAVKSAFLNSDNELVHVVPGEDDELVDVPIPGAAVIVNERTFTVKPKEL